MTDKKPIREICQEQVVRRRFFELLTGAGGFMLGLLKPGSAASQAYPFFGPEVQDRPGFFFAQLAYGNDLSWNPHPTAARSLMEIMVRRTSVPASPDRVDLRLSDPKLFYHPFIYWTGSREFEPFTELIKVDVA